MRKHSLLKTNILVCTIILIGFFITAIVSYRSNIGVFEKDVEHVSTLATEGINSQIESIFSRPVSVSLTMANDHLLKSFLTEEIKHPGNRAYITKMPSLSGRISKRNTTTTQFFSFRPGHVITIISAGLTGRFMKAILKMSGTTISSKTMRNTH